MTPILNITDITTGYQSGANQKIISKNLNLTIERGAFIALLGPNGCGKSTLLRTIAGLQKPLGGNISINQINVQKIKSKEKARLLSLVLTDRISSAYLIVEDIVGMGRYPHIGGMGILSEQDRVIVRQSLRQCNMESFAQRTFSELSDGEKQRVLLARALAQDTPLMMLDEPTAHLDLPNRVELMRMLRDLAKQTNKAILLSTHELDLALQWCDGIWLMNKDGVVNNGAPEDLVLNGSFSDVFSNDNFYFDIPEGIFKMKREPKQKIYIKGNTIIKEWTRRAIERENYASTEDESASDLKIIINDQNKWLLEHNNNTTICNTIQELIKKIGSV